jgi:uncharacterized protein (DUF736 family)
MAIIGHFSRNPDGSFTGAIITLSVQAQDVRIIPVPGGSPDGSSHRIMVGAAHFGDARPGAGTALRLALDDPSFAAPIEADLVEQPCGGFALVWRR